jgi:glycosyltransferase involved in cell wall biosynthesis
MKKEISLDIIMLSTFDRNAGGRETWLYNFLPELFKDDTISTVNLFGFKTPDEIDHGRELLQLVAPESSGKELLPVIFERQPGRFPKALSMFKALKKYNKSRKAKPDAVLAMGIFELIMMNRIHKYKGVKKVVWLRSIFTHEKAYAIPKAIRKFFLQYEIRQLKKADILISNGDDIRDFYKQFNLEVSVIKNGVSLAKWNVSPPSFKNEIHVAYVGRLSQVKGIEDFLKLAVKVRSGAHAKRFRFHTVGDPSVYAPEVAELEKKGILKNHGIIPNDSLPEFLKRVSVCVALTYASESGGGGGTSNAMLEQMAAGRVLLAWDNRIFRQYLHRDNAYLAPQYSVKDLELKLYEILNDPGKAVKIAEAGRRSIQPYSYTANVNSFKKLVFQK